MRTRSQTLAHVRHPVDEREVDPEVAVRGPVVDDENDEPLVHGIEDVNLLLPQGSAQRLACSRLHDQLPVGQKGGGNGSGTAE